MWVLDLLKYFSMGDIRLILASVNNADSSQAGLVVKLSQPSTGADRFMMIICFSYHYGKSFQFKCKPPKWITLALPLNPNSAFSSLDYIKILRHNSSDWQTGTL